MDAIKKIIGSLNEAKLDEKTGKCCFFPLMMKRSEYPDGGVVGLDPSIQLL